MSSAMPKERRLNFRSQTTFALPICVRLEGSDQECFARLYDVSSGGIGLILSQSVREGDTMWVITLRNNLKFKVLWSRPNEEESATWLCGLAPLGEPDLFSKVFGKFII